MGEGMKVLSLTRYSRQGASSRLRFIQYYPYLEQSGLSITHSHLLNDSYIKNLYKNQNNLINIISGYLKRAAVLMKVKSYDVIWIEKELFPGVPPFFEWLLSFSKVRVVLDYDDAIHLNYSDRLIDRLFFRSGKIPLVVKYSDKVVVCSEYAKNIYSLWNKNISIIPTSIDLNKYPVDLLSFKDFDRSSVVIGWIGTPKTFKYLSPLLGVFDRLSKVYNLSVYVIGVDGKDSEIFKYIPWSEDTEFNYLSKIDIGIMPLPDREFERGKCGYKLIQYMGCGVPVVASPVGVNGDIIKNGFNGFLSDSEEWYDTLQKLICSNRFLIMKKNSRVYVENNFSVQSNFKKIVQILKG
jgi:glycosyltransferase involved in cell wall biosynthesis